MGADHPEVVCERLGHASIGVTLDTHSHVMPGIQEEAAEKIDAKPSKVPARSAPSRDSRARRT